MTSFMKNITLLSQSAALYRDEKLSDAGVSGYQAKYLLAVFGDEGVSQDALAKKLFVNKSNVARQVGALEAAGFLKRQQSAEDKRVMLVYTTEKGKALVPAIREANANWRGIICEGLSEEDKEELSRILSVLVANAEKFMGGEL